jgi:hypothetical protein
MNTTASSTDKSSIDTVVRSYVQEYCSPDQKLISFISNEYNLLQEFLGGKTFQSGSYGRGTAINPVNDLDVIWVIPANVRKSIDLTKLEIGTILQDLANQLSINYKSKNKNVNVSAQSHSVLIEFPDRKDEFSVDVVPAIELTELNSFNLPYYLIPEVGVIKRYLRKSFYEDHKNLIDWIKTDPKGYLNEANNADKKLLYYKDCVKILKTWKRNWKKKLKDKVEMKLKSFHLEQIVFETIQETQVSHSLDLLLAVFEKLPSYMLNPQIKDRAQGTSQIRYIDSYINDLTQEQKDSVTFAKNCALSLYEMLKGNNFDMLDFVKRLLSPEEMLSAHGFSFSDAIQNKSIFVVDGQVQPKSGLLCGALRTSPLLQKGLTKGTNSREIKFQATNKTGLNGTEYWKVRNTGKDAFEANSLRGEITRLSTLQNPERTAYSGHHFVTCYLVDEVTNKVLAYDTIEVIIN